MKSTKNNIRFYSIHGLVLILFSVAGCFGDSAFRSTTLAELKADNDGDGFNETQGDCNDADKSIYPGAPEVCDDGIDQDCNEKDISCNDVDNDGDGYTENQSDCNDADKTLFPGAQEVCSDGIDQDCNGKDLDCKDVDDDKDGFTENQADCDDADAKTYPGAAEECDSPKDYNCNGSIINCKDLDRDGDGSTANVDCNDNNVKIYPGAQEICGDGIDQNCDGSDLACSDLDMDGDGYSLNQADCDDNDKTRYPGAPESCYIAGQSTPVDYNCDGTTSICKDLDSDGYLSNVDCNDDVPSINPGAKEQDNGIDDNCNGLVDDNADCPGKEVVYHKDNDEDGFGNKEIYYVACTHIPPGYSDTCDDLKDDDEDIYPTVLYPEDNPGKSLNLTISSLESKSSTISIAVGTYKESGITIKSKDITLIARKCYKVENGKVVPAETIIDGDNKNNILSFYASGVNEESSIIGLIFQNGNSVTNGGALYINNSNVLIDDAILRNNIAINGGGIALENVSNLTIQRTTIDSNKAKDSGGGIYLKNKDGILAVSDMSLLSNNEALGEINSTVSTYHGGGALFFDSSSNITITGSEIRSNKAKLSDTQGANLTLFGAGILGVQSDNIRFSANSFNGNKNEDSAGGAIALFKVSHMIIGGFSSEDGNEFDKVNESHAEGGAIYLSDLSDTNEQVIANNSFIGSQSLTDGGGLYLYKTNALRIEHNTFHSNIAKGGTGGGGIYITTTTTTAPPKIINNTFLYNKGTQGGGIYIFTSYDKAKNPSQYAIENNTFENNIGVSGGGAIAANYSSPVIRNNRIKDNTTSGDNSNGGGIYLEALTSIQWVNETTKDGYDQSTYVITLEKNTISGNTTKKSGGGIFKQGMKLNIVMTDNTIENNSAYNTFDNAAGLGGGMYIGGSKRDSNPEDSIIDGSIIKNNIIRNNIARTKGGGIYFINSVPVFSQNVIIGNKATYSTSSPELSSGGGIYLDLETDGYNRKFGTYFDRDIVLDNNIIAENTSYYGGGLSFAVYSCNSEAYPTGQRETEYMCVNGNDTKYVFAHEDTTPGDNLPCSDYAGYTEKNSREFCPKTDMQGNTIVRSDSILLRNNVIANNSATVLSNVGGTGAGVYMKESDNATLSNNLFYYNYSVKEGSALYIAATSDRKNPGGVFNSKYNTIIRNDRLSSNTSDVPSIDVPSILLEATITEPIISFTNNITAYNNIININMFLPYSGLTFTSNTTYNTSTNNCYYNFALGQDQISCSAYASGNGNSTVNPNISGPDSSYYNDDMNANSEFGSFTDRGAFAGTYAGNYWDLPEEQ